MYFRTTLIWDLIFKVCNLDINCAFLHIIKSETAKGLLLVYTTPTILIVLFFYLHSRTCLLIFLERGEGEGRRNIDVREKQRLLSCAHPEQPLDPQRFTYRTMLHWLLTAVTATETCPQPHGSGTVAHSRKGVISFRVLAFRLANPNRFHLGW